MEQHHVSNVAAHEDRCWTFDADTDTYIVQCPSCSQCHLVAAKQFNCKQFACGADQKTGKPLRPHIKPAEVSKLLHEGCVIGGCGRRFMFNPKKNELAILE